MTTFDQNIQLLNTRGFNFNQSLNIIKRVNKHIAYCIENKQNYKETLFFVSQDFSFDSATMEMLMLNCIFSDNHFNKYYA